MAHISELISNLPANLSKEPKPLIPIPAKLSTQTEQESQQVSCPDCNGLGFFRLDVPITDRRFGKPIPCENPVHTADRVNRLTALSNLGAGDLARRLTDIKGNDGNRKMLKEAWDMINSPSGWLYIWGGPGNAKTEVLISIVNEINEARRGPAMYVTFAHLVNWVREAFKDNADEGYIQRFNRLLNIRLLAVDEMDKARGTEFSDEFRFHFLDERYRQAIRGETMMVFASNSNPNTLPVALWDRVRDGRFRIVLNTAPSARPHMKRG